MYPHTSFYDSSSSSTRSEATPSKPPGGWHRRSKSKGIGSKVITKSQITRRPDRPSISQIYTGPTSTPSAGASLSTSDSASDLTKAAASTSLTPSKPSENSEEPEVESFFDTTLLEQGDPHDQDFQAASDTLGSVTQMFSSHTSMAPVRQANRVPSTLFGYPYVSSSFFSFSFFLTIPPSFS